MKRILLVALMLLAIGGTTEVYSQSWLKKLGKKVENKAKQNVENRAEKAVDKAFDKADDTVSGKGKKDKKDKTTDADVATEPNADERVAQDGAQQQKGQSLEMTYAKNDFVPGDEIIFEDNIDNEQMGEFPSQWDLYSGISETASVGGKKAILLSKNRTSIGPLMKNPKNYLGDIFTIEFDVLHPNTPQAQEYIEIFFHSPDKNDELMIFFKELATDYPEFRDKFGWKWLSSNGTNKGQETFTLTDNEWHHYAISFNKRAWKVYIDGVRYINVPNVVTPPGWFDIRIDSHFKEGSIYLTNFRIAKGAVPLYDRMMSDGKFITYGITFDVGKSTIKPESMGEINRIVKLMTENPDLKFSVEGHTDATGNATSNQTLSEARSKSIVNKLVEMGIAADRLTSSGKGQTTPIADNATDEGRAKNRRVEFVKI